MMHYFAGICRSQSEYLREGQCHRGVWVLTNKQIEAGAKAIAEDMMLPGGGRKKLARVVNDHLDWFDAVEARGLTWSDISRLLLAAGAKDRNGRAISVGTLSSTVWRKRSDAASPISPASTRTRATVRASPRMGQAERTNVIPSKPSSRAGDRNSVVRTKRKHASKAKQPATQSAKPASRTAPSDTTTSKAQTLAFMKRAASIRRGRSD